ncbi:adenosine kinase [Iodidimonas gelatinilytica]|uniref:Adenosine kinase n=1 Tax=Iodidimonas gelatinilytica TaxID=1236966 RepID=A0A5A7MR75_9PROT|nr:adenosine kinase [Iodidimonas gelatinilytica]GEQ97458.1 adenosine kinase [Iodidimonas gelatinilytica]GER01642.1 adenosine kinase [Iodidimonas gelatinilytica]
MAPIGSEQVTDKQLDMIGIGNAIVDVLARADDGFLETHAIQKGGMTLIDADRAGLLYSAMGPGIEVSGGSVANSTAGFAALGGRSGFIGKVKDDQLGQVFAHDIRATGVEFKTSMAKDGDPTARCLIMVTPDGQRSMNTYLGATQGLTEADIDPAYIASAEVVYLEGYLWDPVEAKKAFLKAMRVAHEAGTKVALSLSDSFCVDRYRSEFLDLVDNHVDILFANEDEIKSLYQTKDFDQALQTLGNKVDLAALTRSEKGSVVVKGQEVHVIDPVPVAKVVDATGAGDLYSAGFLYAWARGGDAHQMGRVASHCASEIISHYGARPETDLKAVVADVMAS